MLLQAYEGAQEPFCAVISCSVRCRSLWGKFAVKVGAVTPPSMRKSLPVMNVPSGPMSSAPTAPTSSGVPPRPTGHNSIMRRYPSPRRSGQLVLGERGEDNAGADRVDSRATFAPPASLGHHPQRLRALGQL